VAGILILGGESLIKLAFGADYAAISYWPVVIIAVGQLFNVFFGSVGYLLSMSGYEKDTLKAQLLAVIINVATSVILVPRFGAVGGALSVAMSLIIWNIMSAVLVKKRLAITPSAL
jgi:O-antigen/teichoic acid export membrane protein